MSTWTIILIAVPLFAAALAAGALAIYFGCVYGDHPTPPMFALMLGAIITTQVFAALGGAALRPMLMDPPPVHAQAEGMAP